VFYRHEQISFEICNKMGIIAAINTNAGKEVTKVHGQGLKAPCYTQYFRHSQNTDGGR
jgi:hypothetical protein